MKAKVHIFADDPWWESEVERYLLHCVDRGFRIAAYQYNELGVCDRETFAFDAAVASAFARSGDQTDLKPWGVDLFLRFPGRVVLLSPLWLKPPPSNWPLCVCQPLTQPELLAEAVRVALSVPSPATPGLEELQGYLPPITLSRATSHHFRSRHNHV